MTTVPVYIRRVETEYNPKEWRVEIYVDRIDGTSRPVDSGCMHDAMAWARHEITKAKDEVEKTAKHPERFRYEIRTVESRIHFPKEW